MRRLPGEGQLTIAGLEHNPTLRNILTPEFQFLDPATFDDISDELLPLMHPDALRSSLMNPPRPYPREKNHATVSYQAADYKWRHLVVTTEEFTLVSRDVPSLVEGCQQSVLRKRDKKLRQETGDQLAEDRSPEAWAAAFRNGMRTIIGRKIDTQRHIDTQLLPRIQVIEQFTEMTQPKNRNLNRGPNPTARGRVEYLRAYVFGDMLKAIGNAREWNTEQYELATRVLQKRLYLDPDPNRKIANFQATLLLANEYFGNKLALMRSRNVDARVYERNHPEIIADIITTDAQRAEEKDAKRAAKLS